MPLYILAGIAVLLNNTVFTWIFSGDALVNIQYWGNALVNGTLNISGLLIAATIGYSLSVNKEFDNPLSTAIVAVAGVIVMMPMSVELTGMAKGATADLFSGVLTYNNLGTGGMFGGILIGLLISELYIRLSNMKKLQINLGNQVPPAVGKSFNVLIPVMISLAVFAVFATILAMCGTDLITLIKSFIQEPLRSIGTSLWGTIILYTLGNLLWLFGIHQSVIYSSILEPLLIINIQENIAAYAAGAASDPHKYPDWMPDRYFEEYEWPEARINPYRGWEVYPKAIYDIARNVMDNYKNIPWFISENGMGVEGEERYRNADGSIDDDYRIEFYNEHLAWLHKAIEEGSNCFGYHPWCAIDCWSWNNAYKNRYGFIGIDLNDQSRKIKKSGRWLKKTSEENAVHFDTDLLK